MSPFEGGLALLLQASTSLFIDALARLDSRILVCLLAAGADILFIDALASVDEMKALGSLPGAAAKIPKVGSPLCAESLHWNVFQ